MNPAIVIVLLGAGAVGIWYLTRNPLALPSHGAAVPTPATIGPNTPAASGGNTGTSWDAGKLANTGIGTGAAVAAGFGATAALWATGIGAIAAAGLLVWQLNRNDTNNARWQFAEALGMGEGRTGYDTLLRLLRQVGRDDLAYTALNIIGKKDSAANEQWMESVMHALQQAINAGQWDGRTLPPAPTSSSWGNWGN